MARKRITTIKSVDSILGLHLNVLFFLGLGPIIYSLIETVFDRMNYYVIMEMMTKVLFFFFLGYVVWCYYEIRQYKKEIKDQTQLIKFRLSMKFMGLLFIISLVGYFVSLLPISQSGIGTIFQVLKYFVYPLIVFSVISFDLSSPGKFFFPLTYLIVFGLLTFISPWRSELILFIAALLLGYLLRSQKSIKMVIIINFIMLLIILPFQMDKKKYYTLIRESPIEYFIKSQSQNLEERFDLILKFFAERLNYGREIGYVQNAIESDILQQRGGNTYLNTLQQLVPRILWANKPSFNQDSGYLLPRQIGLLGLDDPETSWGVNIYAEFIWNFPFYFLVLFVPAIFFSFYKLEFFAAGKFINVRSLILFKMSMFFLTLQLVGLVNTITYILWLFITIAIIDQLILIKEIKNHKSIQWLNLNH